MTPIIGGIAAVAASILLSPTVPRAAAAPGDIGFEGPSYAGVSNPPTSDKPQSKLWHHDGLWWATMFHAGSGTWHIFRLDRQNQSWVDTGVQVDNRKQTLSDALWDGNKLYVASHWVTTSSETSTKPSTSNPARLYRYSYDSTSKAWSLDPGFPATINTSSSESLTIDKDTTGTLWATWTRVTGSASTGYTAQVYVSSTAGSDLTWRTPSVLPVQGAAGVHPDDISAVVAFGKNRIGVLWPNQQDDAMYWAVHRDGAAPDAWQGSVAVRGKKEVDDHLNVKSILSDDQGRVYAATKTSLDEAGAPKSSAQIRLLVFRPGTGAWSSSTFGTIADCHTRPALVLDEESNRVHMFATGPTQSGCPYSGAPGTIYHKSAPMSDPVFPAGRGEPVIRDASSEKVNNVTSTKQTVNSSTGLVVLAGNDSTDRYWHADLALGEPPPAPVPVSGFTATPESGTAPLTVQLTDTSTNGPTSWSWDFGDGTTSTVQNPTVTYQGAGTYTIRLTAGNASGPGSTATRTINVSPPAEGDVVRRSSSTAVNTTASTTLTIDAPAGTQAGDVLVTCLVMNGSSLAKAPAGWTRFAAPSGVSNPRVYGYSKVAEAGEPAGYEWRFHSSVASAGGVARYSGTSGLDGEASTATGASAGSATLPGVTTSAPGAMLTGCMAVNSSSQSIVINGPSGLAEVWDLGGKRHEYADGVQSAAGASGPKTWTFSSSREWAGWLVALRPS